MKTFKRKTIEFLFYPTNNNPFSVEKNKQFQIINTEPLHVSIYNPKKNKQN